MLIRSCIAGCLIAVLPSCASNSSQQVNLRDDPSVCQQVLTATPGETDVGLPADNIQLANWNIEKGNNLDWDKDLAALSKQSNLLLLQEAIPQQYLTHVMAKPLNYSFAKGYRAGTLDTGVMTASTVAPLAECHLSNQEPWLRTPKATNITKFALEGTSQTLIVVNIHAVNFALGLEEYNRQLWQINEVLRAHDGPIILAGDFNTWREGRMDTLESLAGVHGLTGVRFARDERVQVLGNYIDHVYVRGLTPLASSSRAVKTSDHNPMTVILSHTGQAESDKATVSLGSGDAFSEQTRSEQPRPEQPRSETALPEKAG